MLPEEQHDSLDNEAIAEFKQFFDQIQHIFLTTHDSFEVLSNLYCTATTEPDFRLPMNEPFKYIQSSWMCPSLFQIANEGLVVLNIAYKNLGMLDSYTVQIANRMVDYVHCAVMLQDIPLYILMEPEFIMHSRMCRDLTSVVEAKLKYITELTGELIKAINQSNTDVKIKFISLLDHVLQSFNNNLVLWHWFAEAAKSMLNIGTSETNFTIETQSLTSVHQVTCRMFQVSAIAKVGADIFADLGESILLNLDELATISNAVEVDIAHKVQNHCKQFQQHLKVNMSIYAKTAQQEFKQFLSAGRDYNAAAEATKYGFLKVTVESADLLEQGEKILYDTHAVLRGNSNVSQDSHVTRGTQWEYTYPNLIEFELADPNTARFSIDVLFYDASGCAYNNTKTVCKFELSSHLGTKEPVTITQPVEKYHTNVTGSVTVHVEKFKFVL